MIETRVPPCPTCGDKSNVYNEGSWWGLALCEVCATSRFYRRNAEGVLVLETTDELSPHDRNAFQRVRRAHGERLPS
jgi:hypothetical protein